MSIHHITEDMIENKPFVGMVFGKYRDGNVILVAHNADFDKRMLPDNDNDWICTKKVAMRVWPSLGSHSNQYLRYALNLQAYVPENLHAHRALYDCYVTAALLKRIIEVSGMSIDEMIELSKLPELHTRFKFGKHKGELITEVIKNDRSYITWALVNMDDELKYSIKEAMKCLAN